MYTGRMQVKITLSQSLRNKTDSVVRPKFRKQRQSQRAMMTTFLGKTNKEMMINQINLNTIRLILRSLELTMNLRLLMKCTSQKIRMTTKMFLKNIKLAQDMKRKRHCNLSSCNQRASRKVIMLNRLPFSKSREHTFRLRFRNKFNKPMKIIQKNKMRSRTSMLKKYPICLRKRLRIINATLRKIRKLKTNKIQIKNNKLRNQLIIKMLLKSKKQRMHKIILLFQMMAPKYSSIARMRLQNHMIMRILNF